MISESKTHLCMHACICVLSSLFQQLPVVSHPPQFFDVLNHLVIFIIEKGFF